MRVSRPQRAWHGSEERAGNEGRSWILDPGYWRLTAGFWPLARGAESERSAEWRMRSGERRGNSG